MKKQEIEKDEEDIYNEGYQKGSLSKEKEVLKILDECSVPVMDEEEMDKFIEANSESSIYRIVNFDKLKQKIKLK